MATMQAWQYTDVQGGLEKSLFLNTTAAAPSKAVLRKGEVLIRVISAALNPADYKLAEIGLLSKLLIKKPATPGFDYCGSVVATHDSVHDLREGQLVFGAFSPFSKYGSLSQLTVVPASECAPLPDGIDPSQAAAVGTAGQTAYQALVLSKAGEGSKVFINGGSGGTGTFGVQIAKAMGAHVTTTCSTRNVDLCKQLGADVVLDYKQVDIISELEKSGPDYDVVVDNIGTPGLYEHSHRFLKPHGRFMQVHFNLGTVRRRIQPAWLGGGRRQFVIVGVKSNTKDLERIGQWMERGKVRSVLDPIPWEDVPKGYATIKAGHTVGKVVVRVPEV